MSSPDTGDGRSPGLELPPEDQLRALLKLIYFAAVESRAEAWQGESESEGAAKERFAKIARLMDAIHNIPGYLTKYGSWDQRYFELCLGSRETEVGKWLHQVYSNALEEARGQREREIGSDADTSPG